MLPFLALKITTCTCQHTEKEKIYRDITRCICIAHGQEKKKKRTLYTEWGRPPNHQQATGQPVLGVLKQIGDAQGKLVYLN
jgi:hypothetical protein